MINAFYGLLLVSGYIFYQSFPRRGEPFGSPRFSSKKEKPETIRPPAEIFSYKSKAARMQSHPHSSCTRKYAGNKKNPEQMPQHLLRASIQISII